MPLIAHRGYSAVAPENTIAALAAALQAGVTALEFDIQETAEGVPVLFHDYRLERTTDRVGRIDELSIDELRDLDAGSWFGPEFRGEPVPTLEEALGYLKGRASSLFVELKAGLSPDATAEALRLLITFGLSEITTIISFDWWALRLIRDLSPRQRIGFLVHTPGEYDGAVLRAAQAGNAIVDCHFELLLADPARIALADSLGVELAVYTVDDPAAAIELVRLGVRGITTNEISRLGPALAAAGLGPSPRAGG